MKESEKYTMIYTLATLVVIFSAVASWVVHSKFEADAFNEITGKNVSTWNAMWIQLRVQESAGD